MIVLKSLLALLLVNFIFANGQQSKKYFRKDYTYLSETESFYKIHTIHRTWQDAKRRCAMEGASFFYPEDKAEADRVLTFWNQTQPFYWLYIGVNSLLAKGVFETIDGRPITDVYSNWSPGEPNDANGVEDCVIMRRDGTLNDERCDKKLPFICKKALSDLVWNQDCDMPYRDYVLDAKLGRCYKFHSNPTSWSEAIIMCSAEESYLAVVNSQAEADFLVKMVENAPKRKPSGNYINGLLHLGFHNKNNEDWTTIKGTPLEDSGYTNWANKQPDGVGDAEQCGSMFFNGQLNDISCSSRCYYICEHDISRLNNAYNERFGADD